MGESGVSQIKMIFRKYIYISANISELTQISPSATQYYK